MGICGCLVGSQVGQGEFVDAEQVLALQRRKERHCLKGEGSENASERQWRYLEGRRGR